MELAKSIVGGLLLLTALLVLPVCLVTTVVAMIKLARASAVAGKSTGQPSLTPAAVLAAVLAAVGFLGTTIGGIGLVFSALWCASPLIVTRAETEASARGHGNLPERSFLIHALSAQAGSALLVALILFAGLVGAFLTGERFDHGADALYATLSVQYAVGMTAVGVASVLSARRLSRLLDQVGG